MLVIKWKKALLAMGFLAAVCGLSASTKAGNVNLSPQQPTIRGTTPFFVDALVRCAQGQVGISGGFRFDAPALAARRALSVRLIESATENNAGVGGWRFRMVIVREGGPLTPQVPFVLRLSAYCF